MNLEILSAARDRLVSVAGEGTMLASGFLRRAAQEVWVYFRELIRLLIDPDDMIPRLGNDRHFLFSAGVYAVFVVVMLLIIPAILRALIATEGDERAPSGYLVLTTSGFFISMPLFMAAFSWVGLRSLYRQQAPLMQILNAIALSIFPFTAGLIVAAIFILVSVGIGLALMLFSGLLGFIFFSESSRLLFGLERPRRIYFAPLVVAASGLFAGISVWIIGRGAGW